MRNKRLKEKGITLVALVVTVVVLLILAGITLTYVLGDNSVFKQASEAKLKADIAQWQEKLEMAKSPVFIEGLGTFDPDRYFDYIQEQGIINNKSTDVIDNGDGTYDVTTKPGYVFLVTLVPSKENPTDAEIEYLGQAGKIAPIIKKIDANATATSIKGKAIVSRLGEKGTIEYYCGLSTADEKDYSKMTFLSNEEGASIDLTLEGGKTYRVKVVAKNDAGESIDYAEVTIGLKVKKITLNPTSGTIDKGVSTTLQLTATVEPEDAENKEIEWKVETGREGILEVTQEGLVTGKNNGEGKIIVTAKDGSGVKGEATIKVATLVKGVAVTPKEATMEANSTVQLNATINPNNATNKSIKWTSSDENIATVSESGLVTAKTTEGTCKITATSSENSTMKDECEITVTESDWTKIAEVAKLVAEDSTINKDTPKINKGGMTINVGDSFYVKVEGETKLKEVIVLGFNHDELTTPNGAVTKAGISFQFKNFMTDA